MPQQSDWRRRAACRGVPLDLFFPGERDLGTEAKATCATCPVAVPCLEEALADFEEFGIRGGMGGDLRRGFARLHRTRPHADPGPVEGCSCGWCTALAGHVAELRGEPQEQPPSDRNGPGATHGLRVSYARGCRCGACTWSASKLGQAVARLGVSTSDHFARSAVADVPYETARVPVDAEGRRLVEHGFRALMAVCGVADAWTAPVTVEVAVAPTGYRRDGERHRAA